MAMCASSVRPQRLFSAFQRLAGGGRWHVLVLAGVVLVGLAEVGFHFRFARAAPSLDEWSAVKPAVSALAGPGGLVVVAPEWAEPNARFAFGDELMPLAHVARADESAFERALEVSILGAEAPALQGWKLEAEREQGRFVFRSWSNPHPMPVLYDFLAHLDASSASVGVLRDTALEPCPYGTGKVSNGDLGGHPTFPRRRFMCSGAEWSMVGLTVIEDQNYRPRRCMWAHPSPRGTLQIHFDAVPIGASITGYGGLPYLFEREWRGTPIELEALVGGEKVGTAEHRDGEGWKRFEFATAAFAGQTQTVDFRVRSRQARDRQFCFQASVR
jgi:hypothetical protein